MTDQEQEKLLYAQLSFAIDTLGKHFEKIQKFATRLGHESLEEYLWTKDHSLLLLALAVENVGRNMPAPPEQVV